MNKNELIAEVAKATKQSRTAVADTLDAFAEVVAKAISKGDEVRWVGFGTFASSSRAATTGRNPRTGAQIKIAASKQPKFKPGKALKDRVNGRSATAAKKKAA